MANRSFNRKQSLEKEVKDLYCKISIGATGAPTLVSGSKYGFASISRTSAGLYALVLQDKYSSLKSIQGTFLSASAEDIRLQLKSETVSSTKILTFFTLAAAVATDPANGTIIILKVEVKNTNVA